MRLAEPQTLQNTYKPHKCCIKRFLFCFLKLFFPGPKYAGPSDYTPTLTCKGSPDQTFDRNARPNCISCAVTIHWGIAKKKRSGCQIVFYGNFRVHITEYSSMSHTHTYQFFVPTRVSKKARTNASLIPTPCTQQTYFFLLTNNQNK